jgi:hypothetical protein
VISETNPPAKPVAKPSPYSLRPTAYSLCRDRRAISLTEVLISMFVLMIGLLGVAAMIPAGRHEILEGAKIDNATAVGRAAFRDLKIRGYLNPANWRDVGDTPILQNNLTFQYSNTFEQGTPGVTPAVAIDPLGITAPAMSYGDTFPYGAGAQLFLTRIYSDQYVGSMPPYPDPTRRLFSELTFRSNDDLLFTPSTAGQDNPPEQSIYGTVSGNTVVQPYSSGATPLKRASEGNYSWLATIVSDPIDDPNVAWDGALASQVTVSVAVFYKRDLSDAETTERRGTILTPATAGFPGNGIGGGEIRMNYGVAPTKPLKPGQWVILAGRLMKPNLPNPPQTLDYYRWYRVVAADVLTDNLNQVNSNKALNTFQNVTLAGADWNPNTTLTEIWMFDNIVTVYEKNMRLEVE